jgi:hypothetical protein
MQLLRRLLNVLYGLAIVTIFVYALMVARAIIPRIYTTTTSIIHCDNGKSFDPDSKPIYPKGDEPIPPRYSDIRYRQISSECEYGTADYVGDVIPHPKNYMEEIINHDNHEGSWSEAGTIFIEFLLGGLLIVEIIKRLVYYIIFSESPLPSKKKR